jgi:hypothetical protein
MQAIPIQERATIQIAARSGTGTSSANTIATLGIHHASTVARELRSQSREL